LPTAALAGAHRCLSASPAPLNARSAPAAGRAIAYSLSSPSAARRCLGRASHDLELALGVAHIARSPLKGGFFGRWKFGVHLPECSRHGSLLSGAQAHLRRAHTSRLLQ
jgi:hypothetical protein